MKPARQLPVGRRDRLVVRRGVHPEHRVGIHCLPRPPPGRFLHVMATHRRGGPPLVAAGPTVANRTSPAVRISGRSSVDSWPIVASASTTSSTRPDSGACRRARIPGSTIGPATTGRTPPAGRRPPGWPGWRRPAPSRRARRPGRRQPVPRRRRRAGRAAPNPFAPAADARGPRTRSSTRRRRPPPNPFAPPPPPPPAVGCRTRRASWQLLGRGLTVAGSYAKVLFATTRPRRRTASSAR